jgi:diaminopimelate decarboxylase/aspartate kinase
MGAYYTLTMQQLSSKACLREFISMGRRVCYYFSLKDLEAKFKELSYLETDNLKFIFPVKSFPNSVVLEMASRYLSGYDISNQNELNLLTKIDSKIIWNSSPYYSHLEGVINDVNCVDDLKQAKSLKEISLRVSTDFLGHESRFGLNFSALNETLNKYPEIINLHLHFGGLKNSIDNYKAMITKLATLHERERLTINFGGGFAPLTIDQIKEIVNFATSTLPQTKVIFEPGRWIAAECGIAIGSVLAIHNKTIVSSLSPTCHLRWIDERANVSYQYRSSIVGSPSENFKISGPSCYESDVLGSIKLDSKISMPGDHIIVENISGYSYAWNHSFNGIQKADLVFL